MMSPSGCCSAPICGLQETVSPLVSADWGCFAPPLTPSIYLSIYLSSHWIAALHPTPHHWPSLPHQPTPPLCSIPPPFSLLLLLFLHPPSSTTIAVTLFPLCLAPLQEPSPAGCDVRSFSLLTSHSSVCLRRLKTFLGVWTAETNASWGVFFPLPSTLSKFRLWFGLSEVLQRRIFRELSAGWVSRKALLLLLLLLSPTGPTEVECVVVGKHGEWCAWGFEGKCRLFSLASVIPMVGLDVLLLLFLGLHLVFKNA